MECWKFHTPHMRQYQCHCWKKYTTNPMQVNGWNGRSERQRYHWKFSLTSSCLLFILVDDHSDKRGTENVTGRLNATMLVNVRLEECNIDPGESIWWSDCCFFHVYNTASQKQPAVFFNFILNEKSIWENS